MIKDFKNNLSEKDNNKMDDQPLNFQKFKRSSKEDLFTQLDAPYFNIPKGQICIYVKKYSSDGNHKLGLCVILEDNIKTDTSAFICPVETIKKYNPNDPKLRYRVYLGKLPLINSENTYYGIIDEIRSMDKRRIILDSNFNNQSFGFISFAALNEINRQYYALLNERLIISKNYEKIYFC